MKLPATVEQANELARKKLGFFPSASTLTGGRVALTVMAERVGAMDTDARPTASS